MPIQTYGLTLAAEADLGDIWRSSCRTWGVAQANIYFDQIEGCLDAIGSGRARSRIMNGLQEGVRILRCEHHVIVWLAESRPIIIAILHERMDLLQRLKGRL